MTANADAKSDKAPPEEEKLLSKWETWAGIAAAVVIVGVTAAVVVWAADRHDHDHEAPVCP